LRFWLDELLHLPGEPAGVDDGGVLRVWLVLNTRGFFMKSRSTRRGWLLDMLAWIVGAPASCMPGRLAETVLMPAPQLPRVGQRT